MAAKPRATKTTQPAPKVIPGLAEEFPLCVTSGCLDDSSGLSEQDAGVVLVLYREEHTVGDYSAGQDSIRFDFAEPAKCLKDLSVGQELYFEMEIAPAVEMARAILNHAKNLNYTGKDPRFFSEFP